jgi:hypothetical protein
LWGNKYSSIFFVSEKTLLLKFRLRVRASVLLRYYENSIFRGIVEGPTMKKRRQNVPSIREYPTLGIVKPVLLMIARLMDRFDSNVRELALVDRAWCKFVWLFLRKHVAISKVGWDAVKKGEHGRLFDTLAVSCVALSAKGAVFAMKAMSQEPLLCESLTNLTIVDSSTGAEMIPQTFPNLQTLVFSNVSVETTASIQGLVSLSSLRKLVFAAPSRSHRFKISSLQHLQQLRELELDFGGQNDASKLPEMPNLTSLQCSMALFDLSQYSAKRSMTHLSWISSLQSLTLLPHHGLKAKQVQQLLRYLPNVVKLEIQSLRMTRYWNHQKVVFVCVFVCLLFVCLFSCCCVFV